MVNAFGDEIRRFEGNVSDMKRLAGHELEDTLQVCGLDIIKDVIVIIQYSVLSLASKAYFRSRTTLQSSTSFLSSPHGMRSQSFTFKLTRHWVSWTQQQPHWATRYGILLESPASSSTRLRQVPSSPNVNVSERQMPHYPRPVPHHRQLAVSAEISASRPSSFILSETTSPASRPLEQLTTTTALSYVNSDPTNGSQSS